MDTQTEQTGRAGGLCEIDRFIDYLRTLGPNPFKDGLELIFQKYGVNSVKIDEALQEDTGIDLHMKIEWIASLPSMKTTEKFELPILAKNQATQMPPYPAREITDYHELVRNMEKDYIDDLEWREEDEIERCTHHLYYPSPSEYQKIPIYAIIKYPVQNRGLFKITFDDMIPYTYASLWYAHAAAYRMMYRLEEMFVDRQIGTVSPVMMNREATEGPFGIWGHRIGNLDYNHCYEIVGLPHQFIVCDFDCNS